MSDEAIDEITVSSEGAWPVRAHLMVGDHLIETTNIDGPGPVVFTRVLDESEWASSWVSLEYPLGVRHINIGDIEVIL